MNADVAIVGSGPAGLAVAAALADCGIRPIVLDGGLTRDNTPGVADGVAAGALPVKLAFGSDYPYRGTQKLFTGGIWPAFLAARASLATGGLGNVWGAACLRARADDIADWPFGIDALTPHYAAIEKLIGLRPLDPGLADWFGEAASVLAPVHPSAAASAILARAASQKFDGGAVGAARVAIGAGCIGCGACLTGCGYGQIFNPADTIAAMAKDGRIAHRPGHVVRGYREDESGVTLAIAGQAEFRAGRVFVAAGVFGSAALFLESVASDATLRLRDSQHFVLPYLLPDPGDGPRGHALAQIFIELARRDLAATGVHLQLYTESEFLTAELARRLGPFGFAAPFLSRRLAIVQGYLHSDASSSVRLTRATGGGLAAEADVQAATSATFGRVRRHMRGVARKLGLVALPFAGGLSTIGAGNHCGGTLPHAHAPGPLSSDSLGRVGGAKRVHYVDASVLPSIPATTITLSVMANAHRIAGAAAGLP